jgi:ribosomal-protein-alanine N-acetyltransferase
MQLNTSVFDSFPVLKTARLTLREIRLTDAPQIFAMRASGRVNQFIARPNMQLAEDAFHLAERTTQAFNNKQAIGWAGILRDNDEIIGTCGFNQIDVANMHAEIGGEMATEYWGKNIAIEAVKAIIEFGLNTMNLHTIEAKVSPQNRGAIFLMEELGFIKEAHYKDRIYFNEAFTDMAVYTLIKGNEKLWTRET